jgi:methionyl-tRNA formyltransferase
VQRAILAGDETTGVTIMEMEKGLDTGPMLMARETLVDAKTAGALTAELAAMGAGMMVEVLERIETVPRVPQPEVGVTYAHKIEKQEARIDWRASAAEVERKVRAFNPAPGAWFELAGERVKLHAAEIAGLAGPPGTVLDERLTVACGEGALRPLALQRAGRGVMTAQELLRGLPLPPGTKVS